MNWCVLLLDLVFTLVVSFNFVWFRMLALGLYVCCGFARVCWWLGWVVVDCVAASGLLALLVWVVDRFVFGCVFVCLVWLIC